MVNRKDKASDRGICHLHGSGATATLPVSTDGKTRVGERSSLALVVIRRGTELALNMIGFGSRATVGQQSGMLAYGV